MRSLYLDFGLWSMASTSNTFSQTTESRQAVREDNNSLVKKENEMKIIFLQIYDSMIAAKSDGSDSIFMLLHNFLKSVVEIWPDSLLRSSFTKKITEIVKK